jgi:hypothetical protein
VSYGDFFDRARAGRLEARTPALHVLAPAGLARREPDRAARLRANGPKLATPRDVHATLRDVLVALRPGVSRAGVKARAADGLTIW